MGHVFKHMSVRLWTTLLIGSLAALVMLPPVAAAIGPEWMIVPGLFLLAAAYWVSGMAFAAMGRRRLNRLIDEATVWQRAGMDREAHQALAQAEATVDSFFFSPFSRKAPTSQLLAQTARFQLSQTAPESSSDAIIGAYLSHFPGDREAAIKWLEGILAGRTLTRKSHDIAAMIGEAHADDMAIHLMLARFYLTERRCDFAALQTYRRLLDAETPPANDLLVDIVDLFLTLQRADSLALKAYVAVHERGKAVPRVFAGIAACRRLIPPTPLTLSLLEKAEAALDGIDLSRHHEMASAFLPVMAEGDRERRPPRRRRMVRPDIGPMLCQARIRIGRIAVKIYAQGTCFLHNVRNAISSRMAKTTVKWTAIGMLIVAVGWLVVNTSLHLAVDFKPVEKAPEPVATPVTDPFTLQVAAYLKESDARPYVTQLKGQGLDAYWTRASGNNKTWYQVRISHFKTKAEAKSVGEDLKARHLIGDYYVANYKRPDIP